MTLSKEDLRANLDQAVRWMMEELGDGWFALLFPDGDKPPYNAVLPTTWRALRREGYVKEHGMNRFELTAQGWLYGVKLLDRLNEPVFHKQMQSLSATLRSFVDPRPKEDEMKDIYFIAQKAGVPEEFAQNAIASRLLDKAFKIRGAYFGDKMEKCVIIPLDYGHKL